MMKRLSDGLSLLQMRLMLSPATIKLKNYLNGNLDGKYNLIRSPTGSGKTFFIMKCLVPVFFFLKGEVCVYTSSSKSEIIRVIREYRNSIWESFQSSTILNIESAARLKDELQLGLRKGTLLCMTAQLAESDVVKKLFTKYLFDKKCMWIVDEAGKRAGVNKKSSEMATGGTSILGAKFHSAQKQFLKYGIVIGFTGYPNYEQRGHVDLIKGRPYHDNLDSLTTKEMNEVVKYKGYEIFEVISPDPDEAEMNNMSAYIQNIKLSSKRNFWRALVDEFIIAADVNRLNKKWSKILSNTAPSIDTRNNITLLCLGIEHKLHPKRNDSDNSSLIAATTRNKNRAYELACKTGLSNKSRILYADSDEGNFLISEPDMKLTDQDVFNIIDNGEIDLIVVKNKFVTGFDCPRIKTVIIAREFNQSLEGKGFAPLLVNVGQMIGRGTRVNSKIGEVWSVEDMKHFIKTTNGKKERAYFKEWFVRNNGLRIVQLSSTTADEMKYEFSSLLDESEFTLLLDGCPCPHCNGTGTI